MEIPLSLRSFRWPLFVSALQFLQRRVLTAMQEESISRRKAELAQRNYDDAFRAELLEIYINGLTKNSGVQAKEADELKSENLQRVQSLLGHEPQLVDPAGISPAKFYDYLVDRLVHAEAKVRQEIKLDELQGYARSCARAT